MGDWERDHSSSCYSLEVREEGGVPLADRGVQNPKSYLQWNFMFSIAIYIPEENMRDFPGDPVIPNAGRHVPHLAQELDPICAATKTWHRQINNVCV